MHTLWILPTLELSFLQLKNWWLQHFISKTTCWFALKFSEVFQHKQMLKTILPICIFLIGCYENCKSAILFVTVGTVRQGESSFIYFIQNINLINFNKFQVKPITRSWDEMLRKASSSLVDKNIIIATGTKCFESGSNFRFSLHSL